MARRLEAAEARHMVRQIEAYRRRSPGRTAVAEPIAGGFIIASDPAFGRKLNHAVGIGMRGAVGPDDIARIEQHYAPHGLATEIDLCPHADPSAFAAVGAAGYRVDGLSSCFGRALTDADLDLTLPTGVEVQRVATGEAERFVEASLAGFAVQAHRRSPALLKLLARLACDRTDTTLYLAQIDDEIAGSAGLARLDTPDGPVAHLYIASTLPAWRGRGVQAALLAARLADARRDGFDLAHVSARPANTSARNAERAGFRLAYTKSTFRKL
jgi:GNAT superfamily N-acetyltransferase